MREIGVSKGTKPMREFAVVGSIVGFLLVVSLIARTAGKATAGLDAQVQIGQLKAEAAGARAEASSLREQLEQAKAQLAQEREAVAGLKRRVAEMERKAK